MSSRTVAASIGVVCFAFTFAFAAACATDEAAPPPLQDLAKLLASENRAEEDRARDEGRRPAEVLDFLEVGRGMTAIDLLAAGGYYTEVLSLAVGESGKVYAQNNEYVLKMRDGANDRAMTARLADGRLGNVERVDRSVRELDLPDESVDFAMTALNFHDIYNGRSPAEAVAFLEIVHRLLKPGGVLGLIDHAGGVSADDEQIHRIDEKLVAKAAVHAGFTVEATSDLLRNGADDRTQGVFAPGLRGHTDRFVMRLRKP